MINPRSARTRLSLSLFFPLCSMATALLVAVMALAVTLPALAQASGGGRVGGVVMDPDGTPIPEVRVVLTFVAEGVTVETTTDNNGRWMKGNLGRGDWNVDFFKDGFKPTGFTTRVSEVNRSKPYPITMEPGMDESGGGGVKLSGAAVEGMNAGNVLYDAGDFAGALAAYEQVLADVTIDDDPNVYLLHNSAGNAAMELDDYPVALGHFEAALAQDPANLDAQLGAAKANLFQRDLEAALAVLETIDPLDISDPIVFYNVGSLLYDASELEPAVKYYGLAIERNPEFGDAHLQLGLCKLRMGDMEGAKAHFERVVEIDPESSNAALAQDFLATIG